MRRVWRPSVLTLALLLLPLAGCESKQVWIDLPSFGADTIQGIWLWRLAEQSGRYERACRIPFGKITVTGGRPTLPYIQDCGYGQTGIDLTTTVAYPAADTVRVSLWYMRWEEPGTYKVTSYGGSGESSLSATTLQL